MNENTRMKRLLNYKTILTIIARWTIRLIFGVIVFFWLLVFWASITPPATDCYDASHDMSTPAVVVRVVLFFLLFCLAWYLTRDRSKKRYDKSEHIKENNKETVQDSIQSIVVNDKYWTRFVKYYNGNEYEWIVLYDGALSANSVLLNSYMILDYISDKKGLNQKKTLDPLFGLSVYREIRFIIDDDDTCDEFILKLQRTSFDENGVGYKVCQINDPVFNELMGKECWFYKQAGHISGVLKYKVEYIYIRKIIV